LQSIKETLGICSGHIPVASDEELGKAAFLSLFGLDDIPSIKFFGDKIMNGPLEDAVFLQCFVDVSLGCFLCPNSNTKLSTKYMGALVNADLIKDFDWPKFIHHWLIVYIKKYLTEKRLTTTLGGCIYHLAVRCLDFVYFGPIKLPSTIPRTKVWKENLIKCFSDMFMDRDGNFGALPLKDIEDTCYRQGESYDVAISKELLSSFLGTLINNKAKECIAASFKIHMKDQDRDVCLRAQCLVRSIVEAIVSANDGSQDTLKIESSEGKQNSNDYAINFVTTEKIQTYDDNDEVEDEDQLSCNARRW